ncbi:cytidylate kinase [Beggiatoa sp. PS]|nr:cytidylate kinase [Beggiatoa sp. PS]
MTNTHIPVVTIDGPSGVGKGTVSLRVAKYLGWHTLDSGALYRILALVALQNEVSLKDEDTLGTLAHNLEVQFVPKSDLSAIQVILNGQEVSQALRSESCGGAASQIATLAKVRQALLTRQRAFRQQPGLVADGRDMGTIVFPDAPIKFFLTASIEERAHRRYKQLKEKGINAMLSNLIKEIGERDQRDSTRTIAPLIAATEAWIIDTTEAQIEPVVARILSVINEQLSVNS